MHEQNNQLTTVAKSRLFISSHGRLDVTHINLGHNKLLSFNLEKYVLSLMLGNKFKFLMPSMTLVIWVRLQSLIFLN